MQHPAARPRRVHGQYALVRLHGQALLQQVTERMRRQCGDPQLEAMVKAARAATKNQASAEEARRLQEGRSLGQPADRPVPRCRWQE